MISRQVIRLHSCSDDLRQTEDNMISDINLLRVVSNSVSTDHFSPKYDQTESETTKRRGFDICAVGTQRSRSIWAPGLLVSQNGGRIPSFQPTVFHTSFVDP